MKSRVLTSIFSKRTRRFTPALLKRISTLPYSVTTSSTIFWTSSSLLTSHLLAAALKPRSTSSFAAAVTPSAKSTRITVAPCLAKTLEVPLPIPCAAPVTIATLPSNFPIVLSPLILYSPAGISIIYISLLLL